MKKTLLFVLPIAFLAAQSIYADNAFSTAPAPAQTYHAVGSDSSSSSATTAAPTPTTTSSPMSTASVDMSPADQTTLPQTASESEMQAADQQIQNLVSSNQAIGTALQTIEQSIVQLQSEVTQLQNHTQAKTSASINVGSYASTIWTDAKSPIGLSIIAVMVLGFGFLMTFSIMRRAQDRAFSSGNTVLTARSQKINSGRPDILVDEEAKSEYDFMNTAEAIPAKLDLARSYMVMNDHDQAYGILKTVMEKGNEEQRLEAQTLIQKIIKKK